MKPINEYTMQECLNAIRGMTCDKLDNVYEYQIADRIHQIWENEQYGLIAITEAHQHLKESIRWVSFAERQPNGSDGDPIHVYDKYNGVHKIWQSQIRDYNPSHWKRIDKPEGV